MTIIIPVEKKPERSFMLLRPKSSIRVGDTLLFQFADPTADNPDQERPVELSVVVSYTSDLDEPGLYSKWQLVAWPETK